MNLTPHEIVADLDQYVIGQQAAKRAIAISYRERSLRLSLGEDRHLITPNNILMVGPSGVGKTELARRLAEMTNAPFVKVEITNYTSSGYVGKSLATIFNELIEHAQYLIEQGATLSAVSTKVSPVSKAPTVNPESCFGKYLYRVAAVLATRHGTPAPDYDNPLFPSVFAKEIAKGSFSKEVLTYRDIYYVKDEGVLVRPAIKKQIAERKNFGKLNVDIDNILDEILGRERPGYDETTSPKHNYLISDRLELLLYTEWLLDNVIINNDQMMPEEVRLALPKRMGELYGNWLERNPRKRKREYFYEHSRDNRSKFNAISKEHLMKLLDVAMRFTTTDIQRDVKEFMDVLKKPSGIKVSKGESPKNNERAIQLVEERGVVFIDEIDKIFFKNTGSDMNIGTTGIQRELMPFLDGCIVKTEYGELDTSNILFIASGAFMMTSTKDIPAEIMGRLPIHITLTPLGKDDLKAVLDKPKRSLLKRYEIIFTAEGVQNFQMTESAKQAIANVAYYMNQTQEDTGARRLKEVLYLVLGDLLYDAHTLKGKALTIDNQYVFDRLKTSNLVLPSERPTEDKP